MPPESERALLEHLQSMLDSNTQYDHPWICEDGHGNAFLVN